MEILDKIIAVFQTVWLIVKNKCNLDEAQKELDEELIRLRKEVMRIWKS